MERLIGTLKRLKTDRRGTITTIAAMLLPAVILASGAAIDYSRLEQFKTQLQAVIDSAALAGAAAYTTSSASGTAQNLAIDYVTANANLLSPHIGTITPSVSTSIVTSGANPGNTVTVSATASIGTTVMKIFTSTLSASASATAVNPTKQVCILVTDPTSSQTLLVNGGVNLNAPTCEIDVMSSSAGAVMINSSLPNIAELCVKGGSTVNGGATVNNLQNHCSPASDPYAGNLPTPTITGTCTVNGAQYVGTTTLSPGTYCGAINFNGGGTVTLSAGNYVFYNATVNFNGGGTVAFAPNTLVSFKNTSWNVNSSWTMNGTAVTFYFADSASYIQLNQNAQANLAAPTTGPYANILMFEAGGLATSSYAIDGTSNGHLMQGLMYLPSRNLTFNSTANVTSDGLTLVVHQLIIDTVDWSIKSSPKTIGGQGTSPRLVM